MNLTIEQLWHYPLKSARGEPLQRAAIHPFGLAQDRRWVLIDHTGHFISQRSCAKMGALVAHAEEQTLTLTWQNQVLQAQALTDHAVQAEVWGDWVTGYGVADQINQQISAWLGLSVRLVYCPDHAQRVVDPKYAGDGHLTAFSDGFPLLLITQASIDALSDWWGSPIDVRRFRPNVVIGGDCAPFAEDGWRRLQVGDGVLELVKPCSRCVIPSFDPDSQISTAGFARFLAQHRRREDGKIYLGQNAILRFPLADDAQLVQTQTQLLDGIRNVPTLFCGQSVRVLD